MTVLRKYNSGTSQWEEILVGVQGPIGSPGRNVQVVSNVKTGVYSTTQTTPIANVTDLNVTIVPTSVSSKIFLILDIGSMGHTDANNGGAGRLYRGTTALTDSDFFMYSAATNPGIAVSTSYLDSPATTSSITYNVRVWVNVGTVRVNGIGANTSTFGVSKYTAIEVL